MTATTDIVQKLWNLCHVLRDDGITYLQYVTELTYLLFLKMMQETEQEAQLPEGYRWGDLVNRDGAAGTGGFLIAADRYIKQRTDDLFDLSEAEQSFQRHQAFYGIELVQDAHRLLLMNMMLHGIEGAVTLGDALSPDGQRLSKGDVILTNPPFGTKKGGGLPSRDDFTYPTSNKQLAFLQHIYRRSGKLMKTL